MVALSLITVVDRYCTMKSRLSPTQKGQKSSLGYNGKGKGQEWIEQHLGWTTQVVRPPPRRVLVAAEVEPAPRPGFTVLPRRWVVERTFAWLGQNRRLSKDYERLCATSEAMVYAATSRLMVRRLAAP
jgi:putative transposase